LPYYSSETDMQEQLTNRLRELKAEFEAGQAKLAEVESQASTLRSTMLRISGAIQVLEEELAKVNGSTPNADKSAANVADPQPSNP
jgi:predicted nuclease with TOPRIM domain